MLPEPEPRNALLQRLQEHPLPPLLLKLHLSRNSVTYRPPLLLLPQLLLLLPLPETSAEGEIKSASFSLLPSFQAPTSVSHWQRLLGSKLAGYSGKCSLQASSSYREGQGEWGGIEIRQANRQHHVKHRHFAERCCVCASLDAFHLGFV